jgi:mono/diheme cytochrome c family protein
MMTRRPIALFAVFAVLLLCLTAPAAAQSAADLYKTKCAACHGPEGRGDTPAGKKFGARDFHSEEVQKKTDKELFDVTKNGKEKMPKYDGKLTDDQIRDLVKYVRELGKK